MLKILQNKLRDAEEEYDDIYQVETAWKDKYSYRRLSRAQNDVRQAERRLTEFYLLNALNKGLSDTILWKITSYL
jgi:hypothetical protein